MLKLKPGRSDVLVFDFDDCYNSSPGIDNYTVWLAVTNLPIVFELKPRPGYKAGRKCFQQERFCGLLVQNAAPLSSSQFEVRLKRRFFHELSPFNLSFDWVLQLNFLQQENHSLKRLFAVGLLSLAVRGRKEPCRCYLSVYLCVLPLQYVLA